MASESVPAGVAPAVEEEYHPRALEPGVLIMTVLLSVIGAIVGLQILTTLGVTPNTAIVGVLVAIAISRIPLPGFGRFRSIHRQNLVQSNISSATFGAANSLLLPIGIPVLMGMPELLTPMLIGATMGMLIDLAMLYWLFDSRIFAGRNAWPPGVAAAEAINAGDKGGRRALLLVGGTVLGMLGAWQGVSMSAFGVAFIGNIFALTMFGVGLLIRGYAGPLAGLDINAMYIPHGMMIGAGLVALIQVGMIILRRQAKAKAAAAGAEAASEVTRSEADLGKGVAKGLGLYLLAAIVLAAISGLTGQMSAVQLVVWVVFAAIACVAAEFIVGLSAMHAGWFPAFATALIFLVLGMIMGFPPIALGLLVGFVASGGPAFADAGYDLKAGWHLRKGGSRSFEMQGRFQQIIAGLVGLGVAWVMVVLFHNLYFANNLFPPVDRVYASTIAAGVDASVLTSLLIWAIPGAIIQFIGGPDRQMGILLATGLLILNPLAGWAVLVGIAIRMAMLRIYGQKAETPMTIVAAGCIAGDALYGFGSAAARAKWTI
ncbi:MAG: OPT/YSL family transporter [Dehalococcoidales bacterium]|nr:OPT/YSL family transporter [Dehalococcoidales bacterium]